MPSASLYGLGLTLGQVSSTETGVIFGNIFYDRGPLSNDSRAVVLADVHIDILDYIKPASCNEAQFRSMWTEFEWENKVNVNSHLTDLREYLAHVMASTNMACLTPDAALSGDCGFLSANMYARSLFGEDALANIVSRDAGVLRADLSRSPSRRSMACCRGTYGYAARRKVRARRARTALTRRRHRTVARGPHHDVAKSSCRVACIVSARTAQLAAKWRRTRAGSSVSLGVWAAQGAAD